MIKTKIITTKEREGEVSTLDLKLNNFLEEERIGDIRGGSSVLVDIKYQHNNDYRSAMVIYNKV